MTSSTNLQRANWDELYQINCLYIHTTHMHTKSASNQTQGGMSLALWPRPSSGRRPNHDMRYCSVSYTSFCSSLLRRSSIDTALNNLIAYNDTHAMYNVIWLLHAALANIGKVCAQPNLQLFYFIKCILFINKKSKTNFYYSLSNMSKLTVLYVLAYKHAQIHTSASLERMNLRRTCFMYSKLPSPSYWSPPRLPGDDTSLLATPSGTADDNMSSFEGLLPFALPLSLALAKPLVNPLAPPAAGVGFLLLLPASGPRDCISRRSVFCRSMSFCSCFFITCGPTTHILYLT